MAPRREHKRDEIVQAATTLFSRYGYKRTSVDLLAAEAGVAKPTVYAYFEDKDAIFRAVVEATCDAILARAKTAAVGPAPIEERLTEVLSAKFTTYWELVHASPHAAELMASQGSLGAEIVDRTDRAFFEHLVGMVEHAKELDPKRVATSTAAACRLLVRAASGASYDATSPATHKKHLGEMVRAIVAAMKRK